MGLLHEVSAFLEHDFGVRVMLAFPSPLVLGLFQLEDAVQCENLLDASPINFGQWVVTIRKHDEARNFCTCNYIRECWVMFLGFPLDYQSVEFVKASVSPFGRLLRWYEGPNKSRILTKCLILSPDRVPHSVVVSHGSQLGVTGRSWSVTVFMLNGHFHDDFPQDEDPVPMDGNPHPAHGEVLHVNFYMVQGWQHDLHGATEHFQHDFGLNDAQIDAVQADFQAQPIPEANAGWDA
jgi:hypothetical protein